MIRLSVQPVVVHRCFSSRQTRCKARTSSCGTGSLALGYRRACSPSRVAALLARLPLLGQTASWKGLIEGAQLAPRVLYVGPKGRLV